MASGGQGPRVRGSVEKTRSQFESTTVGKFKVLEETGGAGSSIKNNNSNNSKIPMPGRSQGKSESTNEIRIDEAEVILKPDVSGSNEEVANKGRRKKGKTNNANKSRILGGSL